MFLSHHSVAFILGLSLLAASASAQEAAPEEDMALLQITLKKPTGPAGKAMLETYIATVGTVKTCPAAMKVAQDYKAEIVSNFRVPPSSLPAQLRDELTTRPAGHPTSMFGKDGNIRFLVNCPELRDEAVKPEGGARQ